MREIDPNSGTFECPSCGKTIEPMEPYLVLVQNNTEPPEQLTFRFDARKCLSDFLSRKDAGVTLQGEVEPSSGVPPSRMKPLSKEFKEALERGATVVQCWYGDWTLSSMDGKHATDALDEHVLRTHRAPDHDHMDLDYDVAGCPGCFVRGSRWPWPGPNPPPARKRE